MKKILILMILLFFCLPLFAEKYKSPISKNKDNYFIFGDSEDQTKFQLSLKADMIYPFKTGLFLGYTQTTWWTVYNGRDTMSSHYQPEVFYKLESKNNIFGNASFGILDFIQISPYYHCSTGVEGDDHRGINLYYGQIQISSKGRVSTGNNIKGFGYHSKSRKNKDIEKYKGYYENDLFLKLNSATVDGMSLMEFHFKHGGTLEKAWLCIEAQTILFSSSIQPRLFAQYYYGYGENIVYYNKKEHSFYGGLLF